MIGERLRYKVARHRLRTIFLYRYGMSVNAASPLDEIDHLQRRWEFRKTFDTSGGSTGALDLSGLAALVLEEAAPVNGNLKLRLYHPWNDSSTFALEDPAASHAHPGATQ